jgi:XTP/dITP diphosphohydrolase
MKGGGLRTEAVREIVLATGNPGKLQEIGILLAPGGISVIPQEARGVPEAEETGLSFVENAIIKARNAARHTGLPALGDDSGLEVDALNGAPGIYSSRYAGPGADDAANIDKLLHELEGLPDERRSARFQCVIVYMRHALDPTPLICQGTWEGRILHRPRGRNGFGYDPVFFVPTHGCSSAELPPAVKNSISHRGQALACLLQTLDI